MRKLNGQDIINHINKKWTNQSCPYCGNRAWTIADKVFELREFNDGNIIVGGSSSILPVIPVTCNNCGHTVFVNAMSSGLMKE